MLEFFATLNWAVVFQIVLIDILLGGDNAVIIALACRDLPKKQRKTGVLLGTIGAILLRIILIVFALSLLTIPFLKIIAGLLLFWIGVKLMLPNNHADESIASSQRLWSAIKTIMLADLIMSIDNVLAIAAATQRAAAEHQLFLIIFGLIVSIPLIIWGSQLVLKLLDRFPFILTLGAALLGWIALSLFISDPVLYKISPIFHTTTVHYIFGFIGALAVVITGNFIKKMRK